MKAHISIIALCAVFTGFSPALFIIDAATTDTIVNNDPAMQLSPGLDDVVKLSKAGVSETVILTYVQHSGVMYSPSPQDLIQLREAGVSPQITTALMQQGAEIRQKALSSQQEAQTAAQTSAQAAAAQTAQPATTYAAAPTYSTPPVTSGSTVVYIGSPGYTCNPNYVYTGYYYPRYYYPRYYGYYPAISLGFHFGSSHGHSHHWR